MRISHRALGVIRWPTETAPVTVVTDLGKFFKTLREKTAQSGVMYIVSAPRLRRLNGLVPTACTRARFVAKWKRRTNKKRAHNAASRVQFSLRRCKRNNSVLNTADLAWGSQRILKHQLKILVPVTCYTKRHESQMTTRIAMSVGAIIQIHPRPGIHCSDWSPGYIEPAFIRCTKEVLADCRLVINFVGGACSIHCKTAAFTTGPECLHLWGRRDRQGRIGHGA